MTPVLSLLITVTARNCGNLSSPPNGTIVVNGCVASYSYSCDGDMDLHTTRQCLENNAWSGSTPICNEPNQSKILYVPYFNHSEPLCPFLQ